MHYTTKFDAGSKIINGGSYAVYRWFFRASKLAQQNSMLVHELTYVMEETENGKIMKISNLDKGRRDLKNLRTLKAQ